MIITTYTKYYNKTMASTVYRVSKQSGWYTVSFANAFETWYMVLGLAKKEPNK